MIVTFNLEQIVAVVRDIQARINKIYHRYHPVIVDGDAAMVLNGNMQTAPKIVVATSALRHMLPFDGLVDFSKGMSITHVSGGTIEIVSVAVDDSSTDEIRRIRTLSNEQIFYYMEPRHVVWGNGDNGAQPRESGS